jgi:hypothetical protein
VAWVTAMLDLAIPLVGKPREQRYATVNRLISRWMSICHARMDSRSRWAMNHREKP